MHVPYFALCPSSSQVFTGHSYGRCFLQVELFDSRRSLNIGIFLRQFRTSSVYEELVGGLLAADSESIGGERLRALLKSLPDDDEMTKVLSYSGDPSRLGPAEKFCRDLALALPK